MLPPSLRQAASEQAYASRRALRINAAYQELSNFRTRVVYDRNLSVLTAPPPRTQVTKIPPPRDHQAELYEQARAHVNAGRMIQAVATLREIQQINPFYRDSASLLAQAEDALRRRLSDSSAYQRTTTHNRRSLLIGGLSSLLIAGASAATWWRRRPTIPALVSAAPSVNTTIQPPLPSITITLPTPTPTTAVPSATPEIVAEEGTLVYVEEFHAADGTTTPSDDTLIHTQGSRGATWPTTSGNGWSVGTSDNSYTITARSGIGTIWAYRTSQTDKDMLIGVDVTVSGGEAGLLLRFNSANTYLAFFVIPASRSFRLVEHTASLEKTLDNGSHPAILSDADARNRLVARLEGDQIDLRVNGQRVAYLSLATPPPSLRYGLAAVADEDMVRADFRNLHLRAL